MTDADTPRVPDFRWIHDHGLFRVDPDGKIYQLVDHNGEPFEEAVEWTSLFADAVKLGDVEAARDTGYNNGWDVGYAKGWEETRAELDKLRADIRAELDDYAGSERDHYAGQSLYRSIADRLDREPGREEPKPRVFLPGDTVPAEVEVWTKDRAVYRWGTDRQLLPYEGAMVEVLYPSPAEWQAIVDRARTARGHVVEHQPDTEETDRG